MKSVSIPEVIKMKPCVAQDILRNISFNTMKRTSRTKSNNYYRGRQDDLLRVILDNREKTVQFIRELYCEYGIRHESLTYYFEKSIVIKEFHERSGYDPKWRKVTYPFVLDESEHFTQSLVQDQYFPDLEDFVKMEQMKNEFKQDSIDWDREMYTNKCKRKKESAKRWMEKTGRTLPNLMWHRK